MNHSQKKRIQNEATFRKLNERIKNNVKSMLDKPEQQTYGVKFVCECSDTQCAETVEITVDQFEKIHADPRRFILIKGHEQPDIESAHKIGKEYTVVEKKTSPA